MQLETGHVECVKAFQNTNVLMYTGFIRVQPFGIRRKAVSALFYFVPKHKCFRVERRGVS